MKKNIMSGGHYQYKYHTIDDLAEEIDREFENDGKFMTQDWSVERTGYEIPMREADYFEGATPEQKEEILTEIKSLVATLKDAAFRAKELEWFMSGDTGFESYLRRLNDYKTKKS
jgi:HEPN domain-containing protein